MRGFQLVLVFMKCSNSDLIVIVEKLEPGRVSLLTLGLATVCTTWRRETIVRYIGDMSGNSYVPEQDVQDII